MICKGSGLIFPLGLLGLVFKLKDLNKDKERTIIALFIVGYLFAWYFSQMRTNSWRHILPILPLLSIFYIDFFNLFF